jgi:hypothetical protein
LHLEQICAKVQLDLGHPTSQANISTKKLLSDFPSHATTPINVDLLEYELCNHPDKGLGHPLEPLKLLQISLPS